jgi:predicted amidophosphoribosyltransferase
VVAVPLGARRLRQRGYNQAELTARSVAAVLGAPVLGGLVRLRDTPPQAGRDETERRRNVAGAFAWTGVALDDRHLWLVDDVLTTGATTAAVAAALVAAGARRVDVATLAAVV